MTKFKEPTPLERSKAMFDIILGAKQDTISQAMIADLIDTIPVIGDISNAVRTKLSKDRADKSRQAIDLLAGLIPIIGDANDIITPTNLINKVTSDLKTKK